MKEKRKTAKILEKVNSDNRYLYFYFYIYNQSQSIMAQPLFFFKNVLTAPPPPPPPSPPHDWLVHLPGSGLKLKKLTLKLGEEGLCYNFLGWLSESQKLFWQGFTSADVFKHF